MKLAYRASIGQLGILQIEVRHVGEIVLRIVFSTKSLKVFHRHCRPILSNHLHLALTQVGLQQVRGRVLHILSRIGKLCIQVVLMLQSEHKRAICRLSYLQFSTHA